MVNTNAKWQQVAHILYHNLLAVQQEPKRISWQKILENFLEKKKSLENGPLAENSQYQKSNGTK